LHFLSYPKRPNPPTKLTISEPSAFSPPAFLNKNRLFSYLNPITLDILSMSGHKRPHNEMCTDTPEDTQLHLHQLCNRCHVVPSNNNLITSSTPVVPSTTSAILNSMSKINHPVEDGAWQQPQKRRKLDTIGHRIHKVLNRK
jgi:hypothetical protein